MHPPSESARLRARHPLAASLERFRTDIDWSEYVVDVTARADGERSVLASALLGDPALQRRWEGLVHARLLREHGDAPVRVASAAVLGALARLCGWIDAALLHRERRVPLAAPESMVVELDGDGEIERVALTDGRFACLDDDPDAGHPDARPVTGTEALAALVRDRATSSAERFVATWSPSARFGPRARWGAVSDVLDSAPWAVSLRDEASGAATSSLILGPAAPPLLPGSRIYQDVDAHGREFFTRDRHFCCFEYLLPETEACFSCPRTPHSERRERASQWPDGGPPD